MDKAKQIAACISVGLLITGCKDAGRMGNELNCDPPAKEVTIQERDRKVTSQVRKDVAEILGISPDTIKESDHFVRDLGADSLDAVEIVMATEEAFDIVIADKDAERIPTVGALIDYVEKKLAGKASGEGIGSPAPCVQIETRFVEVGSGTEDLAFDWVVIPSQKNIQAAESPPP